MEKWKEVDGFPNYYISSKGRLKRITEKGIEKYLSSNIKDKDGYIKTSMNKDGKRYYLRMHRIVADNFIPNPNNLPIVNHKNGIKDDNRVENLEWSTIADNTQHAYDVLGRKGTNGGMNIKVSIIYDNGSMKTFDSQRECAKYLNVSEPTIMNYIKYPNRTKNKKYIIVRDYEGVTTIENTSN